jgi:predicted unusual protein kinase regulating ubiquinone biosynthesis (AarF/ABC1/UbiB family)
MMHTTYCCSLLIMRFYLSQDCDPHPGNVVCDAGVLGGRIIYYDFGMMGALSDEQRRATTDLAYGVIANNVTLVAKSLRHLGMLREDAQRPLTSDDYEAISHVMRQIVRGVSMYDAGRSWVEKVQTDKDGNLREQKLLNKKKFRSMLLALSRNPKMPFRFPSEFTGAFRAFSMLEGICMKLDKDFELKECALPIIRSLTVSRNGLDNVVAAAAFRAFSLNVALQSIARSWDKVLDSVAVNLYAWFPLMVQRCQTGFKKMQSTVAPPVEDTDIDSTTELFLFGEKGDLIPNIN